VHGSIAVKVVHGSPVPVQAEPVQLQPVCAMQSVMFSEPHDTGNPRHCVTTQPGPIVQVATGRVAQSIVGAPKHIGGAPRSGGGPASNSTGSHVRNTIGPDGVVPPSPPPPPSSVPLRPPHATSTHTTTATPTPFPLWFTRGD